MVDTINPAVSGSRRTWVRQIGGFLLGSYAGAMASALLVIVIFVPLRHYLGDLLPLLVVVVATPVVLRDFGVRVPVPYRQDQVPEWIRHVLPPVPTAIVYGAQLGFGFLTRFTKSTHMAFLLIIGAIGFTPIILASIGVYAFARTLVLGAGIGTETVQEVFARFQWSSRRDLVLKVTASAGTFLALVGFATQQSGG